MKTYHDLTTKSIEVISRVNSEKNAIFRRYLELLTEAPNDIQFFMPIILIKRFLGKP